MQPESSKPNYLIVLSGPTGIGKTATGIQLAKAFGSEIISSDSRQFYRELQIGTAMPTAEELASVPHHFIGHRSIVDDYNIFQYEKDALSLLDQLFQRQPLLFLVGGSGMYIDAICNGIDDIPDTDPELREELNQQLEKEGVDSLRIELKLLDPESYSQIDLKNPKRVLRALEVCLSTGQSYSSFKKNQKKDRNFQIVRFVLSMDRELLYQRIDQRVDQMIEAGLQEEARQFYPQKSLNALKTVGYSEFFDYFDGTIPYEEAIRLIKRNSRRYAKRQLSWFHRDPDALWIKSDELPAITEKIIALTGIRPSKI